MGWSRLTYMEADKEGVYIWLPHGNYPVWWKRLPTCQASRASLIVPGYICLSPTQAFIPALYCYIVILVLSEKPSTLWCGLRWTMICLKAETYKTSSVVKTLENRPKYRFYWHCSIHNLWEVSVKCYLYKWWYLLSVCVLLCFCCFKVQ